MSDATKDPSRKPVVITIQRIVHEDRYKDSYQVSKEDEIKEYDMDNAAMELGNMLVDLRDGDMITLIVPQYITNENFLGDNIKEDE